MKRRCHIFDGSLRAVPQVKSIVTCVVLVCALALGGCHQDMWNQPKAKAQSLADPLVFSDGANSRLPVAGAVAFNKDRPDHEFFTGFGSDGKLVKEFPVAVNAEFLKRGQNRFRIFCTPCHGELGDGKGFIAERGFTLARPVGNYHSDRLRNMPIGHFYDVVSNGYGTMFPFKSRIKPIDRWAIAAYIRVLQESQHTPLNMIPPDKIAELQAMPKTPDQNAAPELPIGSPPPRELNAPRTPVGTRQARIVPLGTNRNNGELPVDEGPSTRAPDGVDTTTPSGGRR